MYFRARWSLEVKELENVRERFAEVVMVGEQVETETLFER